MGKRYQQLLDIIAEIKPKSIVEVGTNSGTRADMMIREAQKHNPEVRYTGFDLFEDATAETNAAEMNAKPRASFEAVWAKLMRPGVSLSLIRGNSRETLHGRVKIADLAFIDGGHSVETIRGDLQALRFCNVIILDDYYTAGVDTTKYGCNEVVAVTPHTVLPVEDTFGKVGIKMVRISGTD
jgi:predicted O-methyltransferase YrrM